jgi:hypothetical protein
MRLALRFDIRRRPPLVFFPQIEQLMRVKQILEGVGPVKKLMVVPEPGNHRAKGEEV